jgi:hypothetical protein
MIRNDRSCHVGGVAVRYPRAFKEFSNAQKAETPIELLSIVPSRASIPKDMDIPFPR